jgi:hypothetical protein
MFLPAPAGPRRSGCEMFAVNWAPRNKARTQGAQEHKREQELFSVEDEFCSAGLGFGNEKAVTHRELAGQSWARVPSYRRNPSNPPHLEHCPTRGERRLECEVGENSDEEVVDVNQNEVNGCSMGYQRSLSSVSIT